jgi:hypothetical protein
MEFDFKELKKDIDKLMLEIKRERRFIRIDTPEKREAYHAHLRECSERVASWPEWKRNCLTSYIRDAR